MIPGADYPFTIPPITDITQHPCVVDVFTVADPDHFQWPPEPLSNWYGYSGRFIKLDDEIMEIVGKENDTLFVLRASDTHDN